jgi:hypothetical protein
MPVIRRYPFFTRPKLRSVQKIGVFLVACIILLAPLNTTQSQNSQAPIYAGPLPKFLAWSTDGSTLVFQTPESEQGVYVNDNTWFEYHLDAPSLLRGNVWPLQPQWTEEQINLLQPNRGQSSSSLIFISPGNHFAVYGGTNTDNKMVPLTIANLDTSEVVKLSRSATTSLTNSDLFNVWWSEDSTKFIVKISAIADHFPYYFYVDNYSPTVQKINVVPLTRVIIGNTEYSISEVFDLSADGHHSLVRAGYLTGSGVETGLVVYDFVHPSLSTIVRGSVVKASDVEAAAFDPDDENKIIALTKSGLVSIDYRANTLDVLNTRLNSRNVSDAVFSPDGRYLAVVYETALNAGALYILDMRENSAPTGTADPLN